MFQIQKARQIFNQQFLNYTQRSWNYYISSISKIPLKNIKFQTTVTQLRKNKNATNYTDKNRIDSWRDYRNINIGDENREKCRNWFELNSHWAWMRPSISTGKRIWKLYLALAIPVHRFRGEQVRKWAIVVLLQYLAVNSKCGNSSPDR